MARADIRAIAAEAGIARGTFYFHFPGKEDVLIELTRREETLIGEELRNTLEDHVDLKTVLAAMIQLIVAAEARLGATLFRDVLSFYFSTTRSDATDPTHHPLAGFVAEHIERARQRGEAFNDIDPQASATFFLLGLYALLVTYQLPRPKRAVMLDKYLDSVLRGLIPRS
jgi:AcrR family transcriptional regulator